MIYGSVPYVTEYIVKLNGVLIISMKIYKINATRNSTLRNMGGFSGAQKTNSTLILTI